MHHRTYSATRRTFWAAAAFYLLIAFEFFYMASPFALYFYSAYGPLLNFMNGSPALVWMSGMFLPHIVVETSSALLNLHNIIGFLLALGGFLGFCIGAGQVYYYKIAKKGAVTGGIYNYIRHPQYLALSICSFGMLLLWPRYIVLMSFLTMLFAYYFLAKLEERECEERFGKTYTEYKARTSMFVPIPRSLADRIPCLPKPRGKRYLFLLMMGASLFIGAGAIANGVRTWSLNSLYAVYTDDSVYMSVVRMEPTDLEGVLGAVLDSPEIQDNLRRGRDISSAKYINYILPQKLFVSEIPMNPVEDGHYEHYLPRDFDSDLYKIVFTRAELRGNQDRQGKDILANTIRRVPVLEVQIDLSTYQIMRIEDPPKHVMYENISVPIF